MEIGNIKNVYVKERVNDKNKKKMKNLVNEFMVLVLLLLPVRKRCSITKKRRIVRQISSIRTIGKNMYREKYKENGMIGQVDVIIPIYHKYESTEVEDIIKLRSPKDCPDESDRTLLEKNTKNVREKSKRLSHGKNVD